MAFPIYKALAASRSLFFKSQSSLPPWVKAHFWPVGNLIVRIQAEFKIGNFTAVFICLTLPLLNRGLASWMCPNHLTSNYVNGKLIKLGKLWLIGYFCCTINPINLNKYTWYVYICKSIWLYTIAQPIGLSYFLLNISIHILRQKGLHQLWKYCFPIYCTIRLFYESFYGNCLLNKSKISIQDQYVVCVQDWACIKCTHTKTIKKKQQHCNQGHCVIDQTQRTICMH